MKKLSLDPLESGWIWCLECGRWDEADPTCPACDGLGIVVGPPEDGMEIARMFAGRTDMGPLAPESYGLQLIRHANDYQ
jgi:hypothetical protein